MSSSIPIFIITFQRLNVLKEAVDSFKRNIATPFRIVISDNHSTYPPLLRYIDELEKEGALIYRNVSNNPFRNVFANIEDYKRKYNPKYFVVTDPDIALDKNPGDVLELYKHLLNKNKHVHSVGPMLRINDIPNYYTLRDEVFKRHGSIWRLPTKTIKWKSMSVRYCRFPIDSTFGMYRGNSQFIFDKRRTKVPALRVHAPYTARHLDWYINPQNPSEDQKIYQRAASEVAHWSASFLNNRHMRRAKSLGYHFTKQNALTHNTPKQKKKIRSVPKITPKTIQKPVRAVGKSHRSRKLHRTHKTHKTPKIRRTFKSSHLSQRRLR